MIIASNFKACQTREATQKYFDVLNGFLRETDTSDEVMVFTPASAFFHTTNGATLGAQNAYPVQNGAYTGETALEQLEEFGIKTILIGHSERRQILGETQAEMARKFDFFKSQGFRIVYCVGEPLEVKQQGEEAILNYIADEFVGIDLGYDNFVVAYEPIWAIGTGLTPTNDEIESILGKLKSSYKQEILYGGSVKVANVKEILALKSCGGVLVGSASLKVNDFIQMINN